MAFLSAALLEMACSPMVESEDFEVGRAVQAARVCAGGDVVEGIDVSKWQGGNSAIDWQAVAADGIDFAFIRVSDALAYPDQDFAYNWEEAKNAGIVRGAYQFFRNNIDPIEQADLLLQMMGPLSPGDLPPVLDLESNDGSLSSPVFIDRITQWLDHVEAATGIKPIIYTRASFWDPHVGSTEFAAHPMWVAHYGLQDYVCPNVPMGWDTWSFHQYTDRGNNNPDDGFREVDGIQAMVDLNFFNGNYDQLLELTVAEEDEPEDPEEPTEENPVEDPMGADTPQDCPGEDCAGMGMGAGGCAVSGGSTPLGLGLLLALICVGRRRRGPARRDRGLANTL